VRNTCAVTTLINESHKLKSRIQFENIPSGQKHLTTIIEAMSDGLKLRVSYQSFGMQSAAEFEVEPYLVKVFKQRWYLVGRSDKLRIYGLDRLQACEAITEHFDLPANFDAEAYFQDCYGIINVEDVAVQDVTIRVSAYQANYLRALPLHHSQIETETTDTYSTFRLHLKPTFDFRQELLSLGEDIEVLQPEWFRLEVKQVVANMALFY
jgi:predicted DNA-binding transcriptional regulator YafY